MGLAATPFASRRSRAVLVAVLLIAAGTWISFRRTFAPPPDPPPLAARPVPHSGNRASPLYGVAFDDLSRALDALDRLRPDARIERAIEIVSGGASTIEPSSAGWSVRHGGRELATLPELADFEDALRALDAVARAADARTASIAGTPVERWAEASPRAIFESLAAGERANGASGDALGPTLALALLQVDTMGLGDEIPARAAAALAVARLDASRPLARETALLAKLLGYSESARRAAHDLPASDAVRAFVEHDADVLRGEAAADPLAATLLLRLLADTGDFAGWSELVRTGFAGRAASLPVVTSGLRLRGLAPGRVFPELTTHAVLALLLDDAHDAELVTALARYAAAGHESPMVLAGMADVLAVTPGALVDRFEESLARRLATADGELAGPRVCRAFYESLFFSALEARGLHRLDAIASAPAALRFHAGLAGVHAPLGREFARWYGNLLPEMPKRSRARAAALAADVVGESRFGLGPRLRSYRALKESEPVGTPADRRELRALLARADSRPEFVRSLLPRVRRSLADLALEERWLTHLARVALSESPREVGRLLFLTRDRAGIERLLDAPLDAEHARELVRRLGTVAGGDRGAIERALRNVVARFPADHLLRLDLAERLQADGRSAEAREVLEDWLALDGPDPGLERARVTARIAEIHLAEGALDEALELAERAGRSGAAYPWLVSASVLEAAGREAEAEATLRRLLERYPGSFEGVARVAALRWRTGDARGAAEFLRGTRNGRHFGAWNRSIAPAFATTFAERPAAELDHAVAALGDAGFIVIHFEILGEALERSERWDLAARFWRSQLASPPLELRARLGIFRATRHLEGAEAAARAARIGDAPSSLAAQALAAGELDLPWLLAESTHARTTARLWLERALAWVEAGCASGERRDRLAAWAGEPRPDHFDALVRHLIGDAPLEELRSSQADRWAKTFTAGVRALAEGRAIEASRWFRITVEGEALGFSERASSELDRLRTRGESLARVSGPCREGAHVAAATVR